MAILIELVRKCENIYCFVMGFLSQSPDVWMFPVNFPIFEDSLRQICRSTIKLDGILAQEWMVHVTRHSRKDFPSTTSSPFLETRAWWCIWIQSWYRHRDMWAVERAHKHIYIYTHIIILLHPAPKNISFTLVLGLKCFKHLCSIWFMVTRIPPVDHHWPVKPQSRTRWLSDSK